MKTQPLDTAYSSLSGPAAALYRQLGACPLPWIGADLLAALTDLDASAAQSLAGTLVDAGLLTTAEGGFVLSPQAHLHARITAEECDADEQGLNAAGLDRLFTFLTNAAGAAEHLITPSHQPVWGRDRPSDPVKPPFRLEEGEALDWLQRHLPTYMAAIRFAFLDKRYALVCELAHKLWPLWLRRYHPEQRFEAQMLAFAAATILFDEHAIGQMITSLAGTLRHTNPIEAFEYSRRACDHYQETGDSMGYAQALNSLGKCTLGSGRLDLADQYFRDAEQLRIDLGYLRGAELSRQGRGLVALARGDAAAAADHLSAAHQTLVDAGDAFDGALTLISLAEAHAALGDLEGALAKLDAAAAALEKAGALHKQADSWETQARILSAANLHEQAECARAQAAELRAASENSGPSHAD